MPRAPNVVQIISVVVVSLYVCRTKGVLSMGVKQFEGCRIHSMDFHLELHVFGVVTVRKKDEILD